MKKNLLGLFAIVLAIASVGFTAFTSVQSNDSGLVVYRYAVYDAGDQDLASSYTFQSASSGECPLSSTLCYFRVEDVNENGIIEDSEFIAAFDSFDSDQDDSLDDENEQAGILEKKN